MSNEFITINNRNNIGDTDPSANSGVDDDLAALLAEVEAPSEADRAETHTLDNIDSVVGRPHRETVSRELLIPAPKEWNIFPEPTEEDVWRISKSIYQYGLLHPITVWKQEDGRYMILGGHTRNACYEKIYNTTHEEAWLQIDALVYDNKQLSETDAARITVISNTDQRKLSTQTTVAAYSRLLKLEKEKSFYGSGINSREAAAKQANVSHGIFSRYMHLMHLIPELSKCIDDKVITAKTGYELSFLDEKLQQFIYTEGHHIDLSTPAAKKLHLEATSEEDVERILKELAEAPKYYKYQISTKRQKDTDTEIVPLFVPKDMMDEYSQWFNQAIDSASLDEKIKEKLHRALGFARP